MTRLKGFCEDIKQYFGSGQKKGESHNSDFAANILAWKEDIDHMSKLLVEDKTRDNQRRKMIKTFSMREPENEGIPLNSNNDFVRVNSDSTMDNFESKILGRISTNSDKPNVENQRLLRNLGVENIMMQLLHHNFHRTQKQNNDYQEFAKSIYYFLIRFCKDNVPNQEKLSEHIDFFVEDIANSPIAIYLLKEIFKNNKYFLTTKGQRTIKSIVREEETIEVSSIQKYQYFKILKTFAKCKGKIVKKNQNEILTQISGSEDYKISYFFSTSHGLEKLEKLVKQMDKANHEDSLSNEIEIEMPNEIHNMISFLDLVALCCEGKNYIAESKTQSQILELPNLYKILVISDICYPFKEAVANVLLHAYLVTSRKDLYDDHANLELLWKITEILVDDLKYKNSINHEDMQIRKYKTPSSDLTLLQASNQYVYGSVVSCLT